MPKNLASFLLSKRGAATLLIPLPVRQRYVRRLGALSSRWLGLLMWAGVVAAGGVDHAVAQSAESPDTAAAVGIEKQVRDLALEGARSSAGAAPRIEVSIGQLDPRLHLAPCQRIEPYLPEGMRLWGKSRIGLRCVQGTVRWNVFLPVTVKAFGVALVATSNATVGSVLSGADLTEAEVDLAEEASPAMQDAGRAVGRVLARPLRPGQSIRLAHLKPRQYFGAGETVSLLAQGAGFSVEGEGQALGNGIEGQPVRVRTESGRIVTGQPTGGHRVELAL